MRRRAPAPRRPGLYALFACAMAACTGQAPVAAPARQEIVPPAQTSVQAAQAPEAAQEARAVQAAQAPEVPPSPPSPSPPSASPSAPPAKGAELPICFRYHTRCDVQALHGCGGGEETRVAIIDELAQCAREAKASETVIYYRKAMLEQGFRSGALVGAAGEHFVRAGVLTKAQVKTLGDVGAQVSRVLAGAPPAYGAIHPQSCRLTADTRTGEVALDCRAAGECAGSCRRRYFVATMRVEAAGLRLKKLSEELLDNGSCGCCG